MFSSPVLPAYNAERTLAATIADFPAGSVDEILLVDDGSKDRTVAIAREMGLSGPEAVSVFVTLATLNLSLYASLSAADRETGLTHDEYGPMTVDWIIYQEAGHQVHHLKQLTQVK